MMLSSVPCCTARTIIRKNSARRDCLARDMARYARNTPAESPLGAGLGASRWLVMNPGSLARTATFPQKSGHAVHFYKYKYKIFNEDNLQLAC